jgi:ASC-1-like (ASCH) protein
MKNWQIFFLLACMAVISLGLTACGSESNDVPSLAATPTPSTADEILDNEALMMEFAECLRNEGLEVIDPVVDSGGNIEKPEAVDGANISKEEWIAAYEVCGEIIENITFEKEEVDRSEQVDQYLALAACMREEGFDIEDPTAETLDTWMADLKNTFDWDDPDAQAVFETCFSGSSTGNSGKGK